MRAVAVAVLSYGCATAEPSTRADVPLAHTYGSIDALAREVLAAFEQGNRARLERVALSEAEFRAVVWPNMPASRPEAGVPVEYAWGDLHQKSVADMLTTARALRGRNLELVNASFSGETTEYRDFSVHRQSVLTVRTATGELNRVRLFGSVIEYGGRVKVFSYVVD